MKKLPRVLSFVSLVPLYFLTFKPPMIILKSTIENIKHKFMFLISQAQNFQDLENIRLEYLSRKGIFAEIMHQLSKLPLEQKRVIGPLLNTCKQECLVLFEEKKHLFDKKFNDSLQSKEKYFDISLYNSKQLQGSLHPLTSIKQEINEIFISMGYEIIDGPEVETEYYNFDALNIPSNHPARDMWDTLWLNDPRHLLRTHTSSVQIHAMKEHTPPFAFIASGRCYRHEATDASHDIQFMQFEGVMVGENISLSNLLATLEVFLQLFFKKNLSTRVRPSYFPFVEPGIEMDIECPFCDHGCSVCKYSQWIESFGAGLIHPHVLKSCGIDPIRYSGFAFGAGLTRLAMLKYGINDIRLLHTNNMEFLQQF